MGISSFIDYTKGLSSAKTDWELMAEMMRMAGLFPMMRQQMGRTRVSSALEMMGLLPPEERARYYEEVVQPKVRRYGLQGYPAAMATPGVLSYAQYAAQDPGLAKEFDAMIGAKVDAELPPNAPPGTRERMIAAIKAKVGVLPVTGHTMPGQPFRPSQEALAGLRQGFPGQVAQAAAGISEFVSGLSLVPEGMRAFIERNPTLNALAMQPVNIMIPGAGEGVLKGLLAGVEGNLQGIVGAVERAVEVYIQRPTVNGYKAIMDQITGAREFLSLGGPRYAAAIQTLQGIAVGVRSEHVEVKVLDPETRKVTTVLRAPEQALAYQNALTERYFKERIAPLVTTLVSGDPRGQAGVQKQLNAELTEAARLGLDLKPLMQGAMVDARTAEALRLLEVRRIGAAIAASQASAVASRASAGESAARAGLARYQLTTMTQDRATLGAIQAEWAKGKIPTEAELRVVLLLTSPGALASGLKSGLDASLAYQLIQNEQWGSGPAHGRVSAAIQEYIGKGNRKAAGNQLFTYWGTWGELGAGYGRLTGTDAGAAQAEGRAKVRGMLDSAFQPGAEGPLTVALVKEGHAPAATLTRVVQVYTQMVNTAVERRVITDKEAAAYLGRMHKEVSPPGGAVPQPGGAPARPAPGGVGLLGSMVRGITQVPVPPSVGTREDVTVRNLRVTALQAVRDFFTQGVEPDPALMEWIRQNQPATYKRIQDDLNKRRK